MLYVSLYNIEYKHDLDDRYFLYINLYKDYVTKWCLLLSRQGSKFDCMVDGIIFTSLIHNGICENVYEFKSDIKIEYYF